MLHTTTTGLSFLRRIEPCICMHGYLMIEMNKRASAKTGDVEKLRQNLKKLIKNIFRISCRCKDLSTFEKTISLLAFFEVQRDPFFRLDVHKNNKTLSKR